MATKKVNYELAQGEDWSLNLRFINKSTGLPIDITGWTVFFTAKNRVSDADADAIIAKSIVTHSAPSQGETAIYLLNTDSDDIHGTFPYDIRYKTDSSQIKEIVSGDLKINPAVTKRKSA